METISKEQAEILIQQAKSNFNYSDKANYIYSKSALDYRLSLLQTHFPPNTLHAIAIKTNNHPEVLKHIAQKGFGLEAASIEEVELAINAGVSTEKIVFDSPVKTKSEIEFCNQKLQGALINVNCVEELNRYPEKINFKLGFRINPLIEVNTDKNLNVSKLDSKFGTPITDINGIEKLLLSDERITALHFHIGSGISDFKPNIKAFKLTVELADKVNKKRAAQRKKLIDTIDIGGGIDFNLSNNGLSEFSQQISAINTGYKLVTEYGKFIHENCALVTSTVEYITKNNPAKHLAFIHVGADLFLRKIYSSMNINYPIAAVGKPMNTVKNYRIVGPLCFAGDVLYENAELPELQEGDELIIFNTGANTYSMWSNHCSRTKVNFIFI